MKSNFENRILEGKRREKEGEEEKKRKKKEKSKKKERLFEYVTAEYPAWFIAASLEREARKDVAICAFQNGSWHWNPIDDPGNY